MEAARPRYEPNTSVQRYLYVSLFDNAVSQKEAETLRRSNR
jgi:hypothetical protein